MTTRCGKVARENKGQTLLPVASSQWHQRFVRAEQAVGLCEACPPRRGVQSRLTQKRVARQRRPDRSLLAGGEVVGRESLALGPEAVDPRLVFGPGHPFRGRLDRRRAGDVYQIHPTLLQWHVR